MLRKVLLEDSGAADREVEEKDRQPRMRVKRS